MGTFDGPGLRLVVFLQGCNFRCLYCANPDTIDACGGKPTPAEEILRMATDQKPFFGRRGGVTFSGGEPTFQAAELVPLVKSLKEAGIHVCIDSNGGVWNPAVEELLGLVDLVLLERSGVPEEFRGRRMVYAVEALVFYLNSSNPVEGFSQEGVRKLFRAARPVWSEYTLQKETDIQRFAVKPSRPDGLRFRSFFFGDGSRPVGIFELGSAPELVLIVSANPEAVGAALYHPEAPVAVKAAAVDGVAPTLRTVTAGSYPLSFFREALTAEEPPETVRNFLEKLRSSVFYELLYDVGSLPVGDRPDRKKP